MITFREKIVTFFRILYNSNSCSNNWNLYLQNVVCWITANRKPRLHFRISIIISNLKYGIWFLMITGKTKKKNFFSTLLFWTRDGLKKSSWKSNHRSCTATYRQNWQQICNNDQYQTERTHSLVSKTYSPSLYVQYNQNGERLKKPI